MIVKTGDTDAIRWKANADLAGATVRLIARKLGGAPLDLTAAVVDEANGIIEHVLTGGLKAGEYRIELEVTRDGQVATFPNDGYASLDVRQDLD